MRRFLSGETAGEGSRRRISPLISPRRPTPPVSADLRGSPASGAVPHRVCARCHELKPLHAFRFDSIGRPQYCKPCMVATTRAWKERHRETLLAGRRAAYAAMRATGVPSRIASSRR
jgi:hypothetical protein